MSPRHCPAGQDSCVQDAPALQALLRWRRQRRRRYRRLVHPSACPPACPPAERRQVRGGGGGRPGTLVSRPCSPQPTRGLMRDVRCLASPLGLAPLDLLGQVNEDVGPRTVGVCVSTVGYFAHTEGSTALGCSLAPPWGDAQGCIRHWVPLPSCSTHNNSRQHTTDATVIPSLPSWPRQAWCGNGYNCTLFMHVVVYTLHCTS